MKDITETRSEQKDANTVVFTREYFNKLVNAVIKNVPNSFEKARILLLLYRAFMTANVAFKIPIPKDMSDLDTLFRINQISDNDVVAWLQYLSEFINHPVNAEFIDSKTVRVPKSYFTDAEKVLNEYSNQTVIPEVTIGCKVTSIKEEQGKLILSFDNGVKIKGEYV